MTGVYCTSCHEFTETPILFRGKKYCQTCYDAMTGKPSATVNPNIIENRNKVIQYLKKVFLLPELPDNLVIGLDNEVKTSNISYEEAFSILYYFFQIKEGYASIDYGVAWIFKNFKIEAKQYFTKIEELAKYNATIDITPTERIVKIPSPVSNGYRKKIDISNL